MKHLMVKLYLKELMKNAETYFPQEVLQQINERIQETFSYGKMEEEETETHSETIED